MVKITFKPSAIRTLVLILSFSLLSGWLGYQMKSTTIAKTQETSPEKKPVINIQSPFGDSVDFSLFWKVWNKLETDFVDKSKIDTQKMVYGAISGMTASLGDPYTVFLPPVQNQKAKESLNGTFEGIGAQLAEKDQKITVVAPIKGSPAEKAGILAGDWILKVNGEPTDGWTVPDAVEKIRGPRKEKVTLTVLHEGAEETEDLDIVRDTIEIASVETEFKDKVAVLRLTQFGDRTNTEWDKQVQSILKNCGQTGNETCRGVVLDLRNNPGGYLQGAVYIASEFLADGLIVTQQHASGSREEYTVNRKGNLLKIPLTVLINEGSASASEIVSGALKVRGRAELVGKKSFGKGSVQEAIDMENGAGLHITTAKWLLPDESWIMGVGIEPDYPVDLDKEQPERDLQLEKAIELLVQ